MTSDNERSAFVGISAGGRKDLSIVIGNIKKKVRPQAIDSFGRAPRAPDEAIDVCSKARKAMID